MAAETPAQVQNHEWWIGALGLQVDDRDAGGAWAVTKGKGVTVAVIDTGVDASVPDLSGALVPGFTTSGSASPTVDHDTEGGGDHGTAMAVHIAGRGTGPGVLGVAPQAKIMPVYLAGDADTDTVTALDKLSAMSDPPQIVNMSYGSSGQCPADLQTAVARAVGKGMILVASAGNSGDSDNSSQFPSNCKGVVAVGAFDPEGKPWASTQRQPYVSIGGPGVDIESYGRNRIPSTAAYGTSFAAAFVSGEYALLRAHWPSMSSRQLVAKLFHATSPLYKGPGYGQSGNVLGFGIGVVNRALRQHVAADASNPVYDDVAKIGGGSTSAAPTGGSSSSPGVSTPPSAPSTVGVSFPGSNNASSSDSSSNTGVIIGVVVAVVVVLAIGGVLIARRRAARH